MLANRYCFDATILTLIQFNSIVYSSKIHKYNIRQVKQIIIYSRVRNLFLRIQTQYMNISLRICLNSRFIVLYFVECGNTFSRRIIHQYVIKCSNLLKTCILYRRSISLRFSRNTEANASEFLEHLKECNIRLNVDNIGINGHLFIQ